MTSIRCAIQKWPHHLKGLQKAQTFPRKMLISQRSPQESSNQPVAKIEKQNTQSIVHSPCLFWDYNSYGLAIYIDRVNPWSCQKCPQADNLSLSPFEVDCLSPELPNYEKRVLEHSQNCVWKQWNPWHFSNMTNIIFYKGSWNSCSFIADLKIASERFSRSSSAPLHTYVQLNSQPLRDKWFHRWGWKWNCF